MASRINSLYFLSFLKGYISPLFNVINSLFFSNYKEGDNKLSFETSEDVSVTETFEKMGFKENLLRGIFAYGNHLSIIYWRIYKIIMS